MTTHLQLAAESTARRVIQECLPEAKVLMWRRRAAEQPEESDLRLAFENKARMIEEFGDPDAEGDLEMPAEVLAVTDDADDDAATHYRWVDSEAERIRVREDARALVDAERRPLADPFDAGTLAEILARPADPPARIEELMPWEASLLLIGQRKVGKTTMLGNMARSLLLGEPFLGRFGVTPLAGEIALLNYEVSAAQVARWASDVGVPPNRFFTVNLRGRRNPLSDPVDRERLAGMLRARGVEAVMVDPFGRAYTGASQNDAGEVQQFLVSLDLFVRGEVGARDLVLTAHAGWNGEHTRDSSALEDWADSLLTVTLDEKEDGDGARYLRAIGRDEDRLAFDTRTRRLTLAGAGSGSWPVSAESATTWCPSSSTSSTRAPVSE